MMHVIIATYILYFDHAICEIIAGSSLMNEYCSDHVMYDAVYPADVSVEATKLID